MPHHTATRRRPAWLAAAVTAIALAVSVAPAARADGFSPAGAMGDARLLATATLLPSGKVLVAGGQAFASGGDLPTADLYDPATNTWATGAAKPPDMTVAHNRAAAALLTNGKVLVAGGLGSVPGASAVVDLYDPTTNTWATGADKPPNMIAARGLATATLLPNGKVLVAGGEDMGVLDSSELYDPTTNTWTDAGKMNHARAAATATLLASGKVLVTGGVNDAGTALSSAELYDPAKGWAAGLAKPSDMATARFGASASLLPAGLVLIAGGGIGGGAVTASSELYDPALNTFVVPAPPPDMPTARELATATPLPSGNVLFAGGIGNAGLSSTALYDAGGNSWSTGAAMATPRAGQTATALCNGRVLLAGGSPGAKADPVASAELYSPGPPAPLTGNLLINGSAEASVGAADANGVAPALGWVTTPNFTVVSYGAQVGFPDAAASAQIGGGGAFFAGGPANALSSACQTVDVSAASSAIDAGRDTATLSAYLGGFDVQQDSGQVDATFLDGAGNPLGAVHVGPVSAVDRANQTRLLPRSNAGPVPVGTRAIKVVMTATREAGAPAGEYNDGYFDNLSLTLATGPPIATPGGGGGGAPGGGGGGAPGGGGGGAPGGGGGGPPGNSGPPVDSALALNPDSFPAAGAGASISIHKRRHRPTGASITYTDSQSAQTTLAVLRTAPGRKSGKNCQLRAPRNRHGKPCTRWIALGSFSHPDSAGPNRLHFTGRIAGHKLAPGSYWLQATPHDQSGRAGPSISARFRVMR